MSGRTGNMCLGRMELIVRRGRDRIRPFEEFMDQSVVLGMEAATDSNRHVLDPEGLCVSVRVEAFLDESKTLELTIGVVGTCDHRTESSSPSLTLRSWSAGGRVMKISDRTNGLNILSLGLGCVTNSSFNLTPSLVL